MNYLLFDDKKRSQFLPLAYTRPVGALRIGHLTIQEKWEHHLDQSVSHLAPDYLQEKFAPQIEEQNCLINSRALPTAELIEEIQALSEDEALIQDSQLTAAFLDQEELDTYLTPDQQLDVSVLQSDKKFKESHSSPLLLNHWPDLFHQNEVAIQADIELLNPTPPSSLPDSNLVVGDQLYTNGSITAEGVTFNTKTGPIFIDEGTEIMEGSHIRGPCTIGPHSVIKMGAKIYGATTIGPYCKVGGEINNSVFIGYSNKAHDGFLGNAVLGEWCNIGADTNNSNLKNNYGPVKLWSYEEETFVKSGLQFCGLVMGDHSKCGINTMFNTGTTVGVSANIFNAGFPRKFIPSFAWGGAQGFRTYSLEKAFEVASRVMPRRDKEFTPKEKTILKNIFNSTSKYRSS